MHMLHCLINIASDINARYYDRIFTTLSVSEGEIESSVNKITATESFTIFNPLMPNHSIFSMKLCTFKLYHMISNFKISVIHFNNKYGVKALRC